MGTLGRARASHYWSNEEGFFDATIKSCMTEQRYADITSHLSFAPRGTAGGWAKLQWIDDVIKNACRLACGITQHAAIDESMIKCLSRYCPWIQYMPKKPIKRGKGANLFGCTFIPPPPPHTTKTSYRHQSVFFSSRYRFPV